MSDISTILAMKAQKQAAILLGSTLIPPSGLGYIPPFNIYKKDYTFVTDFDITRYQVSGKTYYVSLEGSDGNDGLTLDTAFATMNKALSMSDVKQVLVKFGLYNRAKSPSNVITKSVSIKAFGGSVTFSCHDNLSWTLNAGSTYQATRSAVGSVWDAKTLDANDDYINLTKRNSIAEVDENPGSWYSDGTTVYVRTSDSRIPDSNIRVYLDSVMGSINGGVTVYLEGINFEGGLEPLKISNTSTANPIVYAYKCKFKYATQTNGVTVLGGTTYLKNCEASKNYFDGFNYHISNNVKCISVEIDCVGRNNGVAGTENNNGSTTHDGCTVTRINGKYYKNSGPNIADVNTAKSWNVNCKAYDSTAITSIQPSNFLIDGDMWLESCTSYGSTYDLTTYVTGSNMYLKDVDTKMNFSKASNSYIIPY